MYECPLCEFVATSKLAWSEHVTSHLGRGRDTWKCPCGKQFSYRMNVLIHCGVHPHSEFVGHDAVTELPESTMAEVAMHLADAIMGVRGE